MAKIEDGHAHRVAIPGRIPCVVPFCRRTAKDKGEGFTEVICAKHWRPIDARLRRRYKAMQRAVQPFLDVDPDTLSADKAAEVHRSIRRLDVWWELMKRQAIEAALGIG